MRETPLIRAAHNGHFKTVRACGAVCVCVCGRAQAQPCEHARDDTAIVIYV